MSVLPFSHITCACRFFLKYEIASKMHVAKKSAAFLWLITEVLFHVQMHRWTPMDSCLLATWCVSHIQKTHLGYRYVLCFSHPKDTFGIQHPHGFCVFRQSLLTIGCGKARVAGVMRKHEDGGLAYREVVCACMYWRALGPPAVYFVGNQELSLQPTSPHLEGCQIF